MNKFIKVFATALLAIFITACEKPDPATEFKTLMSFLEKQQQESVEFQGNIQAKLLTQDPAQITSALNDIKAKNERAVKELDALKISSNEIKPLKDKVKSNVVLGNELLADALALFQNPTAEFEQQVKDKTQNLLQATQELQQLQAELQAKFGAEQPAQ